MELRQKQQQKHLKQEKTYRLVRTQADMYERAVRLCESERICIVYIHTQYTCSRSYETHTTALFVLKIALNDP